MQKLYYRLLFLMMLLAIGHLGMDVEENEELSDGQLATVIGADCVDDFCTGCWLKRIGTSGCVGIDSCSCKSSTGGATGQDPAACAEKSVMYQDPTMYVYDASLNPNDPEDGPDNYMVTLATPEICRYEYQCTPGAVEYDKACSSTGCVEMGTITNCRFCSRGSYIEQIELTSYWCTPCEDYCGF